MEKVTTSSTSRETNNTSERCVRIRRLHIQRLSSFPATNPSRSSSLLPLLTSRFGSKCILSHMGCQNAIQARSIARNCPYQGQGNVIPAERAAVVIREPDGLSEQINLTSHHHRLSSSSLPVTGSQPARPEYPACLPCLIP